MRLRVRVTPRAARARLGAAGGSLRAWVTEPAQGGRANESLRVLVAETLGVRRSEVAIVAGVRSRDKTLAVPDRAGTRVRAFLAE